MPRNLIYKSHGIVVDELGRPLYCEECPPCATPWMYAGVASPPGDLVRFNESDDMETIYDGAADTTVKHLTIRGEVIYFTHETDVRRCNLDGSDDTLLLDGTAIGYSGITHDDDYLYISSDINNLYRCNFDGTGLTTLIGDNTFYGPGIHAYGNYLYYAYFPGSPDGIRRCDKDGTNITTLISAATAGDVVDVYVADGYIYWVHNGLTVIAPPFPVGAVRRAAIDGSGTTTLFAPIQAAIGGGARNNGVAVWESLGRIYFSWGSHVYRVDLDGSNLVDVSNLSGPTYTGVHAYDP